MNLRTDLSTKEELFKCYRAAKYTGYIKVQDDNCKLKMLSLFLSQEIALETKKTFGKESDISF